MTLGSQLDRYQGIGPGFDHLRIGLSIAILTWHSFGAVYGQEWVETVSVYILSSLATLLPMFFGLSGFLIMGSAFRTRSVRTFITFRMLRIFPALFIEVTLSAIVLGALVTTLPLREYYTHPQFLEYFGSLYGAIKFWLPGVFTTNPISTVNGALWTVGPEIACYCLIAAMMISGLFSKPFAVATCGLLLLLVCAVTDYWETSWNIVHIPGKALILSFIAGNLIYLYRFSIPYRLSTFLTVLFVSIVSLVLSQSYESLRFLVYVAAVALPYCSAFIGLTALGSLPFFHRGDYSYGIYIYGFPIQQTLVHFFPDQRTWWFNLGLSLPLSIVFAVASWHLIEKPALSLRKLATRRSAMSVQPRVSPKNVFALVVILVYGAFVTNASRVFPLRAMYYSITGQVAAGGERRQEQF